ncbi:hypothetical protein RRG08_034203 [Elysia crispata]|uniref:Uncharacterized protein n=1 Tax=Elysia crispata TaxID=231223 RepID=A0AAE1A0F0_9GAST|nr:hypothetical protein RRG08_034203 [Elysia crispata]
MYHGVCVESTSGQVNERWMPGWFKSLAFRLSVWTRDRAGAQAEGEQVVCWTVLSLKQWYIEGTGLCFGVDYLWMSLEKAFGQRAAPRSLGRERGGGGTDGSSPSFYRSHAGDGSDKALQLLGTRSYLLKGWM